MRWKGFLNDSNKHMISQHLYGNRIGLPTSPLIIRLSCSAGPFRLVCFRNGLASLSLVLHSMVPLSELLVIRRIAASTEFENRTALLNSPCNHFLYLFFPTGCGRCRACDFRKQRSFLFLYPISEFDMVEYEKYLRIHHFFEFPEYSVSTIAQRRQRNTSLFRHLFLTLGVKINFFNNFLLRPRKQA